MEKYKKKSWKISTIFFFEYFFSKYFFFGHNIDFAGQNKLFFFWYFIFFCARAPGLLLTIMPSCHVFGRFLFFFPSCHHHATGGGGAGLSLSITWGFPPRWHDGMMA